MIDCFFPNHQLHKTHHSPSYKLRSNPNGRNGGATDHVGHFRANGLAIWIRVEFHDGVFGPQVI
jgi:hypothetical protein